jgi:toxin YoeB
MRIICFTTEAWDDYLFWQSTDKQYLKRINALIKDAQRHPNTGIGKPEPLKHELAGCWSRRIDEVNRLVYMFTEHELYIISCRYHYA